MRRKFYQKWFCKKCGYPLDHYRHSLSCGDDEGE